ncbi:MAG: pentapeptide repeat-containing protein [Promethearchaeota archaeon]
MVSKNQKISTKKVPKKTKKASKKSTKKATKKVPEKIPKKTKKKSTKKLTKKVPEKIPKKTTKSKKPSFVDEIHDRVSFAGQIFRNQQFIRVKFNDVDFFNTTFENSTLEDVEFSNCQLNKTIFRKAKLVRCNFSENKLSQVDFEGTTLKKCMFIRSSIQMCSFTNANVHLCDFYNAINVRGSGYRRYKAEMNNLVSNQRGRWNVLFYGESNLTKSYLNYVAKSLTNSSNVSKPRLIDMKIALPHFDSLIPDFKEVLQKCVYVMVRDNVLDLTKKVDQEFLDWLDKIELDPKSIPKNIVKKQKTITIIHLVTVYSDCEKYLASPKVGKMKPEVKTAMELMVYLEGSGTFTNTSKSLSDSRLRQLGLKMGLTPAPFSSIAELMQNVGFFNPNSRSKMYPKKSSYTYYPRYRSRYRGYHSYGPTGPRTHTNTPITSMVQTGKSYYIHATCSQCGKSFHNRLQGKFCTSCMKWHCISCLKEPARSYDNWDYLQWNKENPWTCKYCVSPSVSSAKTVIPGDISKIERAITPNDELTDFYIRMGHVEKNYYYGHYDIKYYIHYTDKDRKTSQSLVFKEEGKRSKTINNPFYLSETGLKNLFSIIQNNKMQVFSDLSIWVLENIANYKGQDPHYYLKVLVEEPGKPIKIPKAKKKIPVCKHCDVMLLRYSFHNIIQQNDLIEKTCPYCKEPLEIEYRKNKLVKVQFNFKETKCSVGLTRGQIGIMYNGLPIKSTVNPAGIENVVKNYQRLFDNNVIGPFKLELGGKNIENFIPIVIQGIEWRSADLYPEDLLAF